MERLRDVQCRPSALKSPIHDLRISKQGKYEEGRKKREKAAGKAQFI